MKVWLARVIVVVLGAFFFWAFFAAFGLGIRDMLAALAIYAAVGAFCWACCFLSERSQ